MGETKDLIKNLLFPNRPDHKDEISHRQNEGGSGGGGFSSRSRSPESGRPESGRPTTTKDRKRRRAKPTVTFTPELEPNSPDVTGPMEAREWPPGHLKKSDAVSGKDAVGIIAAGAPIFKGFRAEVKNVPKGHFNYYAVAFDAGGDGYDAAKPFHAAFSLSSFWNSGPGVASSPWETLEQPSLAFSRGRRPGTITLNHWAGLSGYLDPVVTFVEPTIKLRNLELDTILARLRDLESGFEEEYPDLMYEKLYGSDGVLKDSERYKRPHRSIDRQIADLITVLGRKDWIDFSRPENWIVGKFFRSVSIDDRGVGYHFFHQLLISMELDVRICSKDNDSKTRDQLMVQLPAPIAYSVAVARRWREGVKINPIDGRDPAERLTFTFRFKKQQLKSVRRFARSLKWKNLDDVESALEHRDPGWPRVEERSSDALTYVSGVILPGASLPWLLINTLFDCDDEAGDELDAITHRYPYSGFQYQGSTYWSAASIVGKVLAPTAQEVGGWIGPCMQTSDLRRTEVARLRRRRPGAILEVKDIKTMEIRSDPLGPVSREYPLDEYDLILPDLDVVEAAVKIEKLSFKKLARVPRPGETVEGPESPPFMYNAGIQFAIDGRSWPLKLNHNTEYISAYPCHKGPHPLFYDYKYKAVNVASILAIQDWGAAASTSTSTPAPPTPRSSSSHGSSDAKDPDKDPDKVLVIEAFGPPDHEVLARAYCSHWKLNAVVADSAKTCMACAVREAYAACVRVVILVMGRVEDGGEGEG